MIESAFAIVETVCRNVKRWRDGDQIETLGRLRAPGGDPISQKLLGQSKGDRIFVKRTSFEEVHFQIEEVLSPYVFAFQDTLHNFSNWFPTAKGATRLQLIMRASARYSRRQTAVTTVLS